MLQLRGTVWPIPIQHQEFGTFLVISYSTSCSLHRSLPTVHRNVSPKQLSLHTVCICLSLNLLYFQ
uniref:Uncharacterized protein n=1 Tax=Anguilla anguilla TaxID=7936 RepID=A0A0E9UPA9_ANGAN